MSDLTTDNKFVAMATGTTIVKRLHNWPTMWNAALLFFSFNTTQRYSGGIEAPRNAETVLQTHDSDRYVFHLSALYKVALVWR
jgi:hypothetical protein